MKVMHIFIAGFVVISSALVWFFLKDDPVIANYPPQNDRIVAFGDSLVEGYGVPSQSNFVSLLSERLNRPITNLGRSGDTTTDGLERMDEVLAEDPGVVILLLGGNDYLRRISEEETRANLGTLIETFQSHGSMVVLLGVRGGILRDGRMDMYEALSKTYNTIYIEDVLKGLIAKPEYMHDAIHPNANGHAVIAERMYDVFLEYGL